MKQVTAEDIPQLVEEHAQVIVDCWAEWCYPCKLQSGAFKKLEEQGVLDDVHVVKLDMGGRKPKDDQAQENRKFAKETYETKSIPTLAFYKEGELVKITRKLQQAEELKEIIVSLYK